MAIITPSTFDPTKNYKFPRLQQGVPLVDADWNESGDALAFELRSLLRWFIGDGVASASDAAFRVDGTGAANDFTIRSGVPAAPGGTNNYDKALRFAGRCTVDGLPVFITADFTYTSQPLHEANGAAADALAARLGVPKIVALPTGTTLSPAFTAYLDIWERLVTPTEDPSLVLPGLGVESCVRTKREVVVRTRAGNTAPNPGDPDFLAGHSYMALANISRPAFQAPVNAADITDVRPRRLTLADVQKRVTLIEQLTVLPAFAAVGSQFSPKVGPPGQLVTLSGRNFDRTPVSVQFGTTAATVVGSVSANQIQVNAPSAPAGAYKITVTTAGGTVVSDDTFNLQPAILPPAFAPSPNQFTPKVGPVGQVVTLFGSNLNAPGLKVTFATIDATPGILTVAPTQITVPVPPGPLIGIPGGVKITITTSGGSTTSTDVFSVI
jgi:hypothetical protein